MAADASSRPNVVPTVVMLLIVVTVLTVPWLLPEASEEVQVQEEEETGPSILRPVLMTMSPLALLVLVRWLASEQAATLAQRKADASTIHRITGSSPGLLLVIIFVLSMIAIHSSLQQALGGAT